jgi:hypothetical protein
LTVAAGLAAAGAPADRVEPTPPDRHLSANDAHEHGVEQLFSLRCPAEFSRRISAQPHPSDRVGFVDARDVRMTG